MKSSRFTFVAVAAALALAGCGGGTSSESGRLSVGITDAPVDNPSAEVMLTVSGLEIHGDGGRINVDFSAPKQISISSLVGGASTELLKDYVLPAGHYEWIRLKVETGGVGDTYLELDGTMHELTIPSSAQTGLKLNRGFYVPAGGSASFTIDFDLRKSIVQDANGYKLKPVLRIVDNVEVGRIAGTVDLNSACSAGSTAPAVYVYTGYDVTPTDINTLAGTGPVVTAPVSSMGNYQAWYLATGEYTVAVACNAGLDQPETTEDIGFAANAYNVTVSANQTTLQNFP